MRDGGLLPRDSVARRLNQESFLLLGGTAALLLQVAHPLVAAGVDQHSSFRSSPHGRLVRTLDTTLAIVFGDTATARRALARINARHVAVRGTSSDGRRYDARDPALLLWVQCTLILTSLRLYELVMGRLPPEDRQRYWDETRALVAHVGLPNHLMPAAVDDLERYEQLMLRTAVVPDDTSRAVATDVLRPYRWLPGPLWWPLDAIAAGLMPPSLRDAFGLRFGASQRIAFEATIVALRILVPLLPAYLRLVPQARRAR